MAHTDDMLLDGPRPGAVIGPWTLQRRLGAGGNAAVWRASGPTGEVALKLVDALAVRPEDLTRLQREHDALASLSHPHVLGVHGHGRSGDWAWMAMECIEGEDLDAQIARWREAPQAPRWAEVERIFRDLALALGHIHEQGFVHRDVKPANVMLTAEGAVKLADFGVVSHGDVSRITTTGSLVGTIAYMAPELIAEEPFDARADLYGLGAVLYAMLTLRRPIEADTVAGYLARHLTTRPRPPHELVPDVPSVLERVAMRLLEKDPARRYPSAAAALAALDAPHEDLPPLHGRDEALAAIRSRLDDLGAGQGGLLLVEGTPGSGRSALLGHAAALARAAGHEVAPVGEAEAGQVAIVDDEAPEARDDAREAAARGALVLLATRPSGLPVDPTRALTLGPLSQRARAQLLRDQGVPTGAARALAARLDAADTALPGALLDQLEALVREGWLTDAGDGLTATRDARAFREDPLPAPTAVRAALERRLAALGPDARELLELLAVLGRATSPSFLARASERPARVPDAMDELVRGQWVRVEHDEDEARLALAHPCAARVVSEGMGDDVARHRHLALARVLGRRRRRVSAEAARHLAAAGHADEALPQLLRAARAALDAGRPDDALEAARHAATLEEVAAVSLDRATLSSLVRSRHGLLGAALLALGRWPEAVPALQEAVRLAKASGEDGPIAITSGHLGRALYRLGRWNAAAEALEQALSHAPAEGLDTGPVRRALADIHLQAGRLDGAMAILRDALEEAQTTGSGDDEARARRGVAHVLGLEGRFTEAIGQLEAADELLSPRGDPRVRAGILARAIELDAASGRFGFALHRDDLLLDLVEAHGIGVRLPEALAFAASLRAALGRREDVEGLARRALLLGRSQPEVCWPGILRAVRSLDRLGALGGDEVDMVLAITDDAPVHHPRAQALALAARLGGERAQEHLDEALGLPAAHWALSQLLRLRDTAIAADRLGRPEARDEALDAFEALLGDEPLHGARLELALMRAAVGTPPSWAADAVGAVAEPLPPRLRASFLARPEVAGLHAAR